MPTDKMTTEPTSFVRGAVYNDDDLLTTDEMAAVRNVPASRLHKERLVGIDAQPWIKDKNLVRYRWGDYRMWIAAKARYRSTSELTAA